jgi:hypothetical protein
MRIGKGSPTSGSREGENETPSSVGGGIRDKLEGVSFSFELSKIR